MLILEANTQSTWYFSFAMTNETLQRVVLDLPFTLEIRICLDFRQSAVYPLFTVDKKKKMSCLCTCQRAIQLTHTHRYVSLEVTHRGRRRASGELVDEFWRGKPSNKRLACAGGKQTLLVSLKGASADWISGRAASIHSKVSCTHF